MSQSYIGKTCPYCQFPLKVDSDVTICSACGIPHHLECWAENGGCTTFGCGEKSYSPVAATERLEVSFDEPSGLHSTPARGGLVNKLLATALALSLLVIFGLIAGYNNLNKNGQGYLANEILLTANTLGNTAGNLNNKGMAAQQGDWLYFISNDSGIIYKSHIDGSNKLKVNDDDSLYINVVGEWIFYINADDDFKIYKIRTNGTGRKKVSEDLANFLLVVGEWIYYTNSDHGTSNIYRLRTDGSASEIFVSDVSRMNSIAVSDNWIYYTNYEREICRINTNGSGFDIIDNAHWASDLVVVGDLIYHIWSYDAGINIYKVRTDGSEYMELISTEALSFNMDQNWIYFISLDDHCIYRTDAEGKEQIRVSEDKASDINLVDEWIFYRNIDQDDKVYKIRTDGSERQLVD